MKSITKAELLKKFEDKKYLQLNFPEMTEEEPIYLRSEIQSLDHFNLIYRDGKKVYLEDNYNGLTRLAKRIFKTDELMGMDTLNNIEFCLYLADYDFKEAKRVYLERYC